MSEIGQTGALWARAVRTGLRLPAAPLREPHLEGLAVLLLCPILLAAALWNGFPIIFYDTGAYMLQGMDHVFIPERSPVYSLFLRYAGGRDSLWYVAIFQCLMTGFVLTEFVRAVRPQASLWLVLGIGAVLCAATGLPWYAAQIEPDCFAGLTALVLYLLAFHGRALGWLRVSLLVVIGAFAASTHMTHLGMALGLAAALAAFRVFAMLWRSENLPRPSVLAPLAVCALGFAILIGCNYAFTKQVFVSRAGSVFLAARMMQDGLIKPVLDSDCPTAGYRMCRYKDKLPARADAWLWDERGSPFSYTGGFRKWGPESERLIRASVLRYPLANAAWAVADTALEFLAFSTGDGIVPQEWVLDPEFRRTIPKQMNAYTHAYQQTGALSFLPFNLIHVPVAALSLIALIWLLNRAWRRRDWQGSVLPAFVLLALLGNAILCGVFSGPHFRYQSRVMWLPALAVLMLSLEQVPALRREVESVT
jgi:hypothetical protein